MKQRYFVLAAASAVAAAVALVSCGGGGSYGSMSGNPSMGAPNSASGVISAFGSILVNGSEYATNASTNVVDGDDDDARSSIAALRVGMTVDLDSDGGSNPLANFVRFRSAVRGEVDSIASDGSSMVVLGQTVVITSATSFGGSDASGAITGDVGGTGSVQVGDYVTVYGFLECTSSAPCSATQVVATLVYGSTTPSIYRAEGYAQVSGSSSNAFTINGLTVDFTTSGMSATYCTPSPCSVSNGELVEVRSTSAPTTIAGALTLNATRIKAISQLPVFTVGSTVSIEGLVSQLTAGSGGAETFDLRGVSVTVSSSVAATVPNLANDQIVRVSGTVASDGTVTASTITIVRFATFTIIAPMDSDGASTITLLGQTFTVNGDTRFADWAQFVQPFNSSNFTSVLNPGDQLIVSGYSTSSGDVATRVERIPKPLVPFDAVEGVVTSDTPSTDMLTIGGVVATLNGSTTLRYPGAGNSPTLTGFFNTVTVNKTVVAVFGSPGTSSGTLNGTGAVALSNNCRWVFDPFF